MLTLEELLAENKKLKEENNRLKELLRKTFHFAFLKIYMDK